MCPYNSMSPLRKDDDHNEKSSQSSHRAPPTHSRCHSRRVQEILARLKPTQSMFKDLKLNKLK